MASHACKVSHVPHFSLYDLSVGVVINHYTYFKNEIRTLPENILFDVYHKLFTEDRLCLLGVEFSDLDVFARVLKVTNRRVDLLESFQSLVDHKVRVPKELCSNYVLRCSNVNSTRADRDWKISLGIRLGGFLSQAGWYAESEKVLSACLRLCKTLPDCVTTWKTTLDCCHRLLHSQTAYSLLAQAEETRVQLDRLVDKLQNSGVELNLTGLYTEYSIQAFYKSDYNEAYHWSLEALSQLNDSTPPRVTVEALSQAAKACVVKRDFANAGMLVRQAVYLAREAFGPTHPKFSDTLLDYGFYLLNSDSIRQSVLVYQKALVAKRIVFGKLNLHVAGAQEDLAYALYVQEYSSGHFNTAREYAEKAITVMKELLPREHLKLASAQRVKALILEEIALDHLPGGTSSETQLNLLAEAEVLHKDALRLARVWFGEDNVQTAKHYGNLGRLYQSMKRYNEAEAMHLKAIEIKEKLLGCEDYEVGLSIGHLASLYNYHMKEFHKAEQLYFRSIKISLLLFSETYSGLEYDYRGLIHVYDKLNNPQGGARYSEMLAKWKELREQHALQEAAPLSLIGTPLPIVQIRELLCLLRPNNTS